MKKLLYILFFAPFLGAAQTFSGTALISESVIDGAEQAITLREFYGGYQLGGQVAYTALAVQAGDVLWFNCDRYTINSVEGGGTIDNLVINITVGSGQLTPIAGFRVAVLRETDDAKQPLPYVGSLGFTIGLAPDIWQCIGAYYSENYRKVFRTNDPPGESPTETATVDVSSEDSCRIVVSANAGVQQNRLTVFADSVQIKGQQENQWARIRNTKNHTKFEYQNAESEIRSFGLSYSGFDAGVVPAKYRYNLAALLDANSLIPKSYADSLHAAGGGGGSGTVTSVGISGGATGLTTSGGPVTTSGTITLAGTLDLDNGGTGATTASGARTALGLGTLATQSGSFSGTSSGTNTGDQTITLTGDVTGSGTGSFATTVGKINGTSLGGLATGILKNTTSTGVPSIATAGTDYQAPITLTTTGTSGAATFMSNTLNIPQYSGGGGTPGGSTGQMQYNNAGAFDGEANITITEGATTGTEMTVAANAVTTGKALSVTSTSVTSGSVLNVASTSTAATSNTLKGVNVAMSGANGTSTQTVTGIKSAVTNTGTSSTNVGGEFSASGGTNNYGLIVSAGRFGIGTSTPAYNSDVQGGQTRIGFTTTVYTPHAWSGLSVQRNDSYNYIDVQSTSTNAIYGSNSNWGAVIVGMGAGGLMFQTAGSKGATTTYSRFWVKDDGGQTGMYLGGSTSANGTITYLTGTIFSQTASSTAITNTTSETSLTGTGVGTKTLAASTLRAGTRLHVVASGTIATDAVTPGTLNIKLKLGSTVVCSTTATTLVAVTGTKKWKADFYLTCRTSGASGVIQAGGDFEFYSAAGVKQSWECAETNTTSFSTTGTLVVDVFATFGTADTDNTMQSTQTIITIEGAN